MDIFCPHFKLCSGCTLDSGVERFGTLYEASSFFQKQGIGSFVLHTGAPCQWRCRAKLSIRGTSFHPLVGLYEKGSHRVVDIPLCRVHHPLINEAANVLRGWIAEQVIVPYAEESGSGLLRYVQLGVDRIGRKVQLVLVLNRDEEQFKSDSSIMRALSSLWNSRPDLWHSLWVNFNSRRDNVIMGSSWNLVFGEEWLWEKYYGKRVCTHPASFVQANPEMFDRLLDKLSAYVPQGSSLVEFYAGGGVIGLSVLDKCKSVVCNEIIPLAEKCFRMSCGLLTDEERSKISFIQGKAENHGNLLKNADVAIVDPPRKGVDPKLLTTICAAANIKRLIYVSCGWQSFCRDCTYLLQQGWRLASGEGFLFFPGTDHIEILAVFERA